MPKTVPPGQVHVEGVPFTTNVLPDVFDDRDLLYRPRLQPLLPEVDVRPGEAFVMTQKGNSCTGHAVAGMINTVLASGSAPVHVSPYMLYRMARRYDEFNGDEDEGSSLRGALKGWYYHGVLPLEDWPDLDLDPEPDVDQDAALARRAMQRPLGAFYRVNAYRLDDMQSAINELRGVVASALAHSGWASPTPVERDGVTMHVIVRPDDAVPLGGHAFVVAGYNSVGFLVQNSWGTQWGEGGFATLPYDDWLDSAYDAWVARPGVWSLLPQRDRRQLVTTTAGVVAAGPGPDLPRLAGHVVNLGNEGLLSASGRFISTPNQVHGIFARMRQQHERWRDAAVQAGKPKPPRRVVLYAHGGLTNERTGLDVAQQQLNWWLNNDVYPVTFAWQTGVLETMLDQLHDMMQGKLPFAGLGFDLVEQADRFVEMTARARLRWMWEEMKENARAASAPLDDAPAWPDEGTPPPRSLAGLPGGSLTLSRLRHYLSSVPDDEHVEVHLAGHSAGAIFLTAMLADVDALDVDVTSMNLLAPAVRVDEFERLALPHLRSGRVGRFASFGLSDQLELDDVCSVGGLAVYQKSVLYLVSRALEVSRAHERSRAGRRQGDVPILGMQRFTGSPLDGSTVGQVLSSRGSELIWSPNQHPARGRSGARSHVRMDEDPATMTSVMLRILGIDVPTGRSQYVPHSPLLAAGQPAPSQTAPDRRPVATLVADVAGAGDVPVSAMAAPHPYDAQGDDAAAAAAPAVDGQGRRHPAATNRVLAALRGEGWLPVQRTSTAESTDAGGTAESTDAGGVTP